MVPDNEYRYMAANTREINPQNVDKENYTKDIGCTINEVEEYIYDEIKAFVEVNGKPKEKPYYFTEKSMSLDKK